jgi:hypothetical protein
MSEEKEVTTPAPEAEKEEETPKADEPPKKEETVKEEESTATFEPVVRNGEDVVTPHHNESFGDGR